MGRKIFIFGLRSTGYFDVQRLGGNVLHHSASYKTVRRLEGAHTLRIELPPTGQPESEAQRRAAKFMKRRQRNYGGLKLCNLH